MINQLRMPISVHPIHISLTKTQPTKKMHLGDWETPRAIQINKQKCPVADEINKFKNEIKFHRLPHSVLCNLPLNGLIAFTVSCFWRQIILATVCSSSFGARILPNSFNFIAFVYRQRNRNRTTAINQINHRFCISNHMHAPCWCHTVILCAVNVRSSFAVANVT